MFGLVKLMRYSPRCWVFFHLPLNLDIGNIKFSFEFLNFLSDSWLGLRLDPHDSGLKLGLDAGDSDLNSTCEASNISLVQGYVMPTRCSHNDVLTTVWDRSQQYYKGTFHTGREITDMVSGEKSLSQAAYLGVVCYTCKPCNHSPSDSRNDKISCTSPAHKALQNKTIDSQLNHIVAYFK